MCKQQVPFSDLLRGVWRAALTLANNLCVQESDRENERDGDPEHIHAAGNCARRIRDWLNPTDEQLAEMLREAGVDGLAEDARGGCPSCGAPWEREAALGISGTAPGDRYACGSLYLRTGRLVTVTEMCRYAQHLILATGARGSSPQRPDAPRDVARPAALPDDPQSLQDRICKARQIISQWPFDVRVALGLADDI